MTVIKDNKYELVCGLEVHAELKTASKMFCGCVNDPFGAEAPNIYTCPVCLGMPGGLPVMNKKAVEWTIQLGLALHCQVNLFSHFDRKHYFYPDLPKGYQISQYDQPFCYGGYLDTSEGRVRITRIHLEEDTAKLLHETVDGKKMSLIDFNRSSVPLVEIVTEPDIKTASQANEYGKKLRQLIRYLEIGECNMEQGGMRLEANVSLRPTNSQALPNYKVEVKNINSFRFLEQAITFEIDRQTKLLHENQTPAQETRGFDAVKGVTFSQRTKESAADYRYFPDPDLPPLVFTDKQIENWRKELPELPEQLSARWQSEYVISSQLTLQLTKTKTLSAWLDQVFVEAKKAEVQPSKLANAFINKKLPLDPAIPAQKIVAQFAEQNHTTEVADDQLDQLLTNLLIQYPNELARYRAGETKLLGFFIGQLKCQLAADVDFSQVSQELRHRLEQLG
ncbi:MAG TPA: Asp-tRNA(Asn)/Glu-tRNA(Gln) amidotransferase subunit GatB [Candidatus Woesebacteria bacterium]|nr:Asp-tRNA(Asn)/Glu-tRNA(Gln) amidotransferase subunit GatB [Candidatus Woesebacteria bacterium]